MCAGFCLGWFHVTAHNAEQKSNAVISANKDNIRADGGEVKEKAEGLGQRTKEKIDSRAGIAAEPPQRQS
jgi:hypothetical protein